ncbi:uncharacterized protein LOC129965365 [Argiope bruennichi]|uniref:uncharacterized protein LOC129965365 n=1 Tax=Argiope bruennichi TaxID=94029 RepID=UPI0024958EB3|nr:uncharacterized protein LOC129965365 [Argiope bruennichi]
MICKIAILLSTISMVIADGYLGHYAAAKPYAFGYTVKDHHGEKHRQESGIGGQHVQGSYGFTDNRGIQRHVDYVADHGGFKASIKTNEPGTSNQDPAAVNIHSSAHPYYGAGYGVHGGYAGHAGSLVGKSYGGYGYEGYGYGGHGYGGHGYAGLGYAGHGGDNGAYGLGVYGHGGKGVW